MEEGATTTLPYNSRNLSLILRSGRSTTYLAMILCWGHPWHRNWTYHPAVVHCHTESRERLEQMVFVMTWRRKRRTRSRWYLKTNTTCTNQLSRTNDTLSYYLFPVKQESVVVITLICFCFFALDKHVLHPRIRERRVQGSSITVASREQYCFT